MFNVADLSAMSNPKAVEGAFVNYLRAFNKKVTKAKTIAHFVAQHAQSVVSQSNVSFFIDSQGAGYTNLTSNQRPESEHFIITEIRMLEGANATVSATDWTEGLSTADVRNAKFDLFVNGVIQMKQFPLTRFVEADEEPYSGIVKINPWIVWGGQEDLEIKVKFETAPATANQNLMIELAGWAFI